MNNLVPIAVIAFTDLAAFVIGWKRRHVYTQLSNTGVTQVAQVAGAGPVGVEGTVSSVEDPITAPFTGREAAVVAWSIKEWDEDAGGSGGSYVEIARGVETTPFHLDDGTGTAAVDLGNHVETGRKADGDAHAGVHPNAVLAEFDDFPVEESVKGRADQPEAIRAFEERVGSDDMGIGTKRHGRRYLEQVIRPGDDAYVLGTATVPGKGGRPGSPDAVTATAREDGLTAVSGLDAATVQTRFHRNADLWLAVGAIVMAICVVAAVLVLL